jgi:hypothetical protein
MSCVPCNIRSGQPQRTFKAFINTGRIASVLTGHSLSFGMEFAHATALGVTHVTRTKKNHCSSAKVGSRPPIRNELLARHQSSEQLTMFSATAGVWRSR